MTEQADRFSIGPPFAFGAAAHGPMRVAKLLIAVGYGHGLTTPRCLVGAIASEAGIPGRAISADRDFPNVTVVELPMQLGDAGLDLARTYMRGKPATKPRMLSQAG